ncbi:MAG: P-II family nitrogen regulator [Clostridiaceae bacterium]|nr:P-II family nitrogen regulator [Clostridiaceae bacterium]
MKIRLLTIPMRICIVVNEGRAGKILRRARELGIRGGTIVPAFGTVRNRILRYLALDTYERELIIILCSQADALRVMPILYKEFRFNRPNKGIMWSQRLGSILGCVPSQAMVDAGVDPGTPAVTDMAADPGIVHPSGSNPTSADSGVANPASINEEERKFMSSTVNEATPVPIQPEGAIKTPHAMVITIVDRGKADAVLEAARTAGSTGGTIIRARGSATGETVTLFNLPVEPEKDTVLILAPTAIEKKIVAAIYQSLSIDQPGAGIIFTYPVASVYGLHGID